MRKEAEITFDRVNLSNARFINTDLEKIIFRDVDWKHPDSKWKKRLILWDELCPLEDDNEDGRDYEKIAENYRQLVINYEKKRDYDTAKFFMLVKWKCGGRSREHTQNHVGGDGGAKG